MHDRTHAHTYAYVQYIVLSSKLGQLLITILPVDTFLDVWNIWNIEYLVVTESCKTVRFKDSR